MVEIVPAIIPENFQHIREQADRVARFVKRVQVDIIDGKFAPRKSWPFNQHFPTMLKKLSAGEERLPHYAKLTYELDMMVERPEEQIEEWIAAGFRALIVHIESTNEFAAIIKQVHEKEIEIGVALNPSTSLEEIEEWIPKVDFVQCMGSDNIGYHGISLNSFVLPRVADLRKRYPELIIGVDIGVNLETAPLLVEHGANKLVSGSAIFESDNIEKTIKTLQTLDEHTKNVNDMQ